MRAIDIIRQRQAGNVAQGQCEPIPPATPSRIAPPHRPPVAHPGPAATCHTCSNSIFWLDPYSHVHCLACDPPLHPAMCRRRLIVYELTPPEESFWIDLDAPPSSAVEGSWDDSSHVDTYRTGGHSHVTAQNDASGPHGFKGEYVASIIPARGERPACERLEAVSEVQRRAREDRLRLPIERRSTPPADMTEDEWFDSIHDLSEILFSIRSYREKKIKDDRERMKQAERATVENKLRPKRKQRIITP